MTVFDRIPTAGEHDLEDEMEILNICYQKNQINPIVPWVNLFGGIFCVVLTISWWIQLILEVFCPLAPVLDTGRLRLKARVEKGLQPERILRTFDACELEEWLGTDSRREEKHRTFGLQVFVTGSWNADSDREAIPKIFG
mgnify:CR=1 FL=1